MQNYLKAVLYHRNTRKNKHIFHKYSEKLRNLILKCLVDHFFSFRINPYLKKKNLS